MLKLSLLALLGAVAYVTAPQTPLQAVQAGLPIAAEVAGRVPGIVADAERVAATRPLFAGDRGPEATALLMLAIVWTESSFRQDVESCEPSGVGDHGRAFGLPQLHAEWFVARYPVGEFCRTREVQFAVELERLHAEREHCPGGPSQAIAGYHMGTSCAFDATSRTEAFNFGRLIARAGITVRRAGKVWTAE